jgi:hypothetical protein
MFYESDNRGEGNVRARLSVVLGLSGVAVVPASLVFANRMAEVKLLYAVGLVAAGSTLLGALALFFARRGRMRSSVTLGRIGGRKTSAVGRFLGTLSLAAGASACIALAVYGLMVLYSG